MFRKKLFTYFLEKKNFVNEVMMRMKWVCQEKQVNSQALTGLFWIYQDYKGGGGLWWPIILYTN